jgi:hypothetical protein
MLWMWLSLSRIQKAMRSDVARAQRLVALHEAHRVVQAEVGVRLGNGPALLLVAVEQARRRRGR